MLFGLFLGLTTTVFAEVQHRFIAVCFGMGKVQIVAKDGAVDWEATGFPCVQDCWIVEDGNVLVSYRTGVKLITPDHQTVWEYKSPDGVELHSAQPLVDQRVLACECGSKRLIEIDRSSEVILEVPLSSEASCHAQFRTARKTDNGTYWVAFLHEEKVQELDGDGTVLREIASSGGAHGVVPLPNGNLLVSGGYGGEVKEYDKDGRVVWYLSKADMVAAGVEKPAYAAGLQRLPNGNTVVTMCGGVPQFFEVTPDKKMVWKYHNPELGDVSGITILDTTEDSSPVLNSP